MNRDEQLELFDTTFSSLKSLLIRKGADYAADGEVLKNFKSLAVIMSLLNVDNKTPEGQCIQLIVLKVDRICNLLFSGKTPSNESITDSVDDLLGYAFLLKCILTNKKT